VLLAQEQDQPDSVSLPISKGQLASLLGTIPETLSRIFSKMSQQGLVQVSGSTILILDPGGLVELAQSGKLME
jgi:CRP/FNR family transcriptional regulator